MRTNTFLILNLFAILCCLSYSTNIFEGILIQDVTREIDLKTQLSVVDTFLKVTNNRDKPIDGFYFAIPNEYSTNLVLLTAADEDNDLEVLHVDNLHIQKENNATLYYVKFSSIIPSKASVELTITETYWQRMIPYPKEITIFDDQLVVIHDSIYLFSPYTVLNQKTIYKLAGTIISHSDMDGIIRGRNLEYNYQTEIGPFSRRTLKIHFENNTPFAIFKNVTRTIEISHWGNIYLEEAYQLANEGALFSGEYSRVDFNQWRTDSGKNALRNMKAKLPVHTWDLHYRDEIGNISTSKASRQSDHVALEIEPRYAILGGWKANWVLSYNLPARNYLYVHGDDPNRYTLKQKFGIPFEKILCEDYTLKIIFPEGSTSIKFDLPFDVDKTANTKTFGYLDFLGRPTVIIEKHDLLSYHNQQFSVSYRFENKNLLTEPLYIFLAMIILFTALIILGRIDFDFGKNKEKRD